MDQVIRKAVLKDNSISQQLNLGFVQGTADRALKIKLEIDVDPPAGSVFEYSYLDFPLDFEVCHRDLSSNFALKIHALLCRPFLKGRDWFDFLWYLKQGIQPNYPLLAAALNQAGPWKDKQFTIDRMWLQAELRSKIESIDWPAAAEDVSRFLDEIQRESLRIWSTRFFISKADQLAAY